MSLSVLRWKRSAGRRLGANLFHATAPGTGPAPCSGLPAVSKRVSRWAIRTLLCCCAGLMSAHAAETWQEALRAMPLPANAPPLNRENAAGILVHSFRSNAVFKGLLILPDVFDDFYLINRDKPALNIRATNLLEALTQLTNVTTVRLTFHEPFVMAHMESDRLEPGIVAEDAATVRQLKAERVLAHVVFVDTHWERLQPRLTSELKRKVLPDANSEGAWHFARHNFAACNLTAWQFIAATALTGKSTATVQKRAIVFRGVSEN